MITYDNGCDGVQIRVVLSDLLNNGLGVVATHFDGTYEVFHSVKHFSFPRFLSYRLHFGGLSS